VSEVLLALLFLAYPAGVGSFGASTLREQPKVLEKLDEASLSRLVSHRAGKVLLINVWATWCDPCVEEFPDLVALDKEFRSRKADIVSVNIDDLDDIASKVLPFLKAQKSLMKTYVNGFKKPEDFINALNRSWSGAVPATVLFDSKGHRREFLIGRQSLDSLRTKLSILISEH